MALKEVPGPDVGMLVETALQRLSRSGIDPQES